MKNEIAETIGTQDALTQDKILRVDENCFELKMLTAIV